MMVLDNEARKEIMRTEYRAQKPANTLFNTCSVVE